MAPLDVLKKHRTLVLGISLTIYITVGGIVFSLLESENEKDARDEAVFEITAFLKSEYLHLKSLQNTLRSLQNITGSHRFVKCE